MNVKRPSGTSWVRLDRPRVKNKCETRAIKLKQKGECLVVHCCVIVNESVFSCQLHSSGKISISPGSTVHSLILHATLNSYFFVISTLTRGKKQKFIKKARNEIFLF